jgi:beta-1,4-glucosyltransferase
MQDDSVIVVNEGVGMDIAALLMQKSRFRENLNGTDFTSYFFQRSKRALRVYLVGGKQEVLQKAADYARHQLGQEIAGVCDGYEDMQHRRNLIEKINRSKPDVVLVALGNPIQEEWILDNRSALDAGVVIGVGALFDFWDGAKARAPRLVQRLRLEWFYRLCLEPRRLFRRYTVDIVKFLLHCHKYRYGDPLEKK